MVSGGIPSHLGFRQFGAVGPGIMPLLAVALAYFFSAKVAVLIGTTGGHQSGDRSVRARLRPDDDWRAVARFLALLLGLVPQQRYRCLDPGSYNSDVDEHHREGFTT